jgi:PQQ-dependent dehydrogenase (methanol/ethanol family)
MRRQTFSASRSAAGLCLAAAVVFVSLLLSGGAAALDRASSGNTDWSGFGNTPNQNRYSPLDQITASNVDQLGRAFTVDLNKVVPGIKKGQQTYPVVIDGKMFITSGDDQVFAVNAATGDVLWHYAPYNIANFKNFGIVANRGVAYCDGQIYLLTLDMTIVALDPASGKQLARVPIAQAVPGAASNYGYSETSAPVCADHHLIVGAAGSEYGVRGFVMAYNTPGLTPAWANPFWTIPPNNTSWRKAARFVGGCTVWTPTTVDPTSNTLYFGTAAAAPLYYPSLRPGNNPRCDSLIAVDLKTGQMKWWQQQLASNQWAYDSSQPPLVYTTKIGGKTRRIVSIATMEGVWFAYDATTGSPIWQRVKVIDNVEHPSLKPGQPVAVYPSSLGGLNYSPASFDPQTGFVYNSAAETASVLEQKTPAQQKRQGLLGGDTSQGLSNGDFGQYLQNGWKDYGSVSAINVSNGQRVWKFQTPQPERGGPTTTAGGVGFTGGGDGNMRAFDVKSGKVLWTFQTGFQIASGPSVYSVDGNEYVAISVGGTPTSSSGGTVASQVQVFSLGGSKAESNPPANLSERQTSGDVAATAALGAAPPANASRQLTSAGAGSAGRVLPPAPLVVQPWNADTSNTQSVQGRVLFAGKPVAGAVVQIGGWTNPTPTDSSGAFGYPADNTLAARHVARVVDVSHATVGGKPLSAAQAKSLLGKGTGISVGYKVDQVSAKVQGGNVVVTGRVTDSAGSAAPTVGLYSYELRGKVTDANGNPVKGAVVTTRTGDRQFWTQSRPSGADGSYASFLVSTDDAGDDPVPMQVGVAVADVAYAEPLTDLINFAKTSSSTLDIQLPGSGTTLVKTSLNPQPVPGAVYEGLLVGVVGGNGKVIRPVSATWPNGSGRFQLVLPSSARGKTVVFWEDHRQFFSTKHAVPGGPVDPAIYPKSLPSDAPQGLATQKLPG